MPRKKCSWRSQVSCHTNTSSVTTSKELHILYTVMLHPNLTQVLINCHSFIHSIGMCWMWWFVAVLRSVFHSSLSYTLPFHPFPPTNLPSSLTSSCHLFLGLPLSLVTSKFIYNTLLRILFSSILCTCPNQRSLLHLIVSVTVHFLSTA